MLAVLGHVALSQQLKSHRADVDNIAVQQAHSPSILPMLVTVFLTVVLTAPLDQSPLGASCTSFELALLHAAEGELIVVHVQIVESVILVYMLLACEGWVHAIGRPCLALTPPVLWCRGKVGLGLATIATFLVFSLLLALVALLAFSIIRLSGGGTRLVLSALLGRGGRRVLGAALVAAATAAGLAGRWHDKQRGG